MSRFVTDVDNKRIHAEWWDKDEDVIIRKFGYGDRQALAGASMNVGLVQQNKGQEVIAEAQIGEMNLAILERGIVNWTLKGPGGKIISLRRRWIEQLKDEDAEYILDEINRLNPRRKRSPEAQATFRGADRGGAEGGESVAE